MPANSAATRPIGELLAEYIAANGPAGGAVGVDEETGEFYTGPDAAAVLAAAGEAADRVVIVVLGADDVRRRPFRRRLPWRRAD